MTPPTLSGPRVLYISGPFSHPDPAPLLRCEPRRRTGHVFPSNPAGAETPHLLITVRGGTRDICKVVGR